jgi:hypothetical protein
MGRVTSAQDNTNPKIHASSIQIQMVQSSEVELPIEFQLALYENLIEQIQKTNKFQHVYRDGDPAASSNTDLVILHSDVYGFKKGSEGKRQLTTVAGATQIKVQLTAREKARFASAPTVNSEAHDAYLLGRYFYFAGRSDDMLKVSGMWVSPAEVEGLLVVVGSYAETFDRSGADRAGSVRAAISRNTSESLFSCTGLASRNPPRGAKLLARS